MHNQAPTDDKGELQLRLPGKVLVIFGLTLSSFALFGMAPVLPAIAAYFSYVPDAGALTRMTLSAVGIVAAIASPLVGALSDRIGAKRVLLISLVLYAVAGCLPFALENLYGIVAARFFMGLAASGYGAVILVLLVKNSTGRARDRWLGYMTTVATVAAMIYGPGVGYIGRFGWRWPFLLYAVAVPLLAMAMVGIPADPPRSSAAGGATSAAKFSFGTPISYVAFVFIAGAVMMSPSIYAPFRMREIGIVDSAVIGNMLLVSSVAGAVAGSMFGWIKSKLSMTAAFMLGFSIIAVGMVILATATNVAEVAVAQVFSGFGLCVNSPNVFLLGSTSGPEPYRARTMGFAKAGLYGGPMIAQILLEPVAKHANLQVVTYLIALACAAMVGFFGWQLLHRRGQSMQPAQ